MAAEHVLELRARQSGRSSHCILRGPLVDCAAIAWPWMLSYVGVWSWLGHGLRNLRSMSLSLARRRTRMRTGCRLDFCLFPFVRHVYRVKRNVGPSSENRRQNR